MQFFKFFPSHILNILEKYSQSLEDNLEEIRIRIGLPIILKRSEERRVGKECRL